MVRNRGVIRSVYFYSDILDDMVEVCKEEKISINSYINRLVAANLKRRGYKS